LVKSMVGLRIKPIRDTCGQDQRVGTLAKAEVPAIVVVVVLISQGVEAGCNQNLATTDRDASNCHLLRCM
jgi:hypothetical protein